MLERQRGRACVLDFNRIGIFGPHRPSITHSRYCVMINTLLWNIRGVSMVPNLCRLNNIIRLHGIQFVAICEPKLDVARVEYIHMRLSFDYALVNVSGDLWIFYSSPFACSVVGTSDKHIFLSIHHPWLSGPMIFLFVHVMCSVEGRRDLWEKLVFDKPHSLPWCIRGDFNVIVNAHEK